MVFSIIYEKNFFVIGNNRRGMGRFTSLLSELNLMGRLIDEKKLEDIVVTHEAEIDYANVNRKLSVLKSQSTDYINEIVG